MRDTTRPSRHTSHVTFSSPRTGIPHVVFSDCPEIDPLSYVTFKASGATRHSWRSHSPPRPYVTSA